MMILIHSLSQGLGDLVQEGYTEPGGSPIGHGGAGHVYVKVSTTVIQVVFKVVGDKLARAAALCIHSIAYTIFHVRDLGCEHFSVELRAVEHGKAQVTRLNPSIVGDLLKFVIGAEYTSMLPACGDELCPGQGGNIDNARGF